MFEQWLKGIQAGRGMEPRSSAFRSPPDDGDFGWSSISDSAVVPLADRQHPM
ncbi:MAG: hypothetical protein ACRDN6_08905 [Gaiellaceae bacterium]